MAPTVEDGPVTHVTQQCHDEMVLPIIKKEEAKEDSNLEVDWNHYSKCISQQSEAIKKDSKESFVKRDMEQVRYVGSVFHPSMSVQNHTYRGDYKDANNVFKALCSTMAKRPEICESVSIVDPFKPYMYEDAKKNQ